MTWTTLIDAQTLINHLDDSSWIIVDCRFNLADTTAGEKAYAKSHIPGAHYAHLDHDLSSPITNNSGRHPLPDIEDLHKAFSKWGIDATKQVVVYDDTGGSIASRLWWLLKWLGHKNVAVLNGGYANWLQLQFPVDNEKSITTELAFQTSLTENFWVTSELVDRIRTDNNYTLIDVRTPERFAGLSESIDKVAGHVPGAINIPWQTNLDENGMFLSSDKLVEKYSQLPQLANIENKTTENIIVMCGSGVTACHTLLALEHAGWSGAKLYAGSWSEWITIPEHSIAKNYGK